MPLTQAHLKQLLNYDPKTGIFTYLKEKGKRHIGDVAGAQDKYGYISIGIDYIKYKAHRLAWLYMTGEFPKNQIDHKDLNKSNNKWENLREADWFHNNQNVGISRNNTSGVKGVSWDSTTKKWRATIEANGGTYRLGRFNNLEEAAAVINAARLSLHGEFSRAI